MTYLVAGFESQLTARAAAAELRRVALAESVQLGGAALVRRDTIFGIHVNPIGGFELPEHVLAVADRLLNAKWANAEDMEDPAIRPGESMLVLVIGDPNGATRLARSANLEPYRVLWTTVST